MTARQGSGDTTGLDGKTVNVTNEKDIQKFLSSKGASPNSGIVGVKGKDKGDEIEKRFISNQKDNPPKEIHFYDDSRNNTVNVSKLGGKIPSELYIYGPGHFSDGSVNPNTPNQSFSEKDADKKKDEKKRVSEVIRKIIRKEIAMNKSEYESSVDDVVDDIYRYTTKFNKYPDINPILEKLASRFNLDIETVYSDVARGFHKLTT
jgi:hypothetical protein